MRSPDMPELLRLYGADWLTRAVGCEIDSPEATDEETQSRLLLIANLTRDLSGFYGDGRAFRAWWERPRRELDWYSPLEHLGASWNRDARFDVINVMWRMTVARPMGVPEGGNRRTWRAESPGRG